MDIQQIQDIIEVFTFKNRRNCTKLISTIVDKIGGVILFPKIQDGIEIGCDGNNIISLSKLNDLRTNNAPVLVDNCTLIYFLDLLNKSEIENKGIKAKLEECQAHIKMLNKHYGTPLLPKKKQ